MEPFSYFTDHQKIVLKQLWFPAIVAVILSVYVNHALYHVVNFRATAEVYEKVATSTFYLTGFMFALILSWEQVTRKDWKRALAIFGGYMLTQFIFQFAKSFVTSPLLHCDAPYFIWNCAQIIGICAIAGKKDYLRTGLFAGAIIHSCAFFPGNTDYLSFDGYNVLAAIHGFVLPYLFWTWLFIAENRTNSDEYKKALRSKIQVVGADEYRLIFPVAAITTWIIIYIATLLFGIVPKSMHYEEERIIVYTSLLSILLCGFALFVAARTTRNIVVGRLMTVGEQGDWLLFLHFIPGVNIIGWLICAGKEMVHTTKEENARFYLSRYTSSLGTTIVTFGVLVNLYNAYMCYAYASYGDVTAGIFMLLFVAKLITYFLVRKGGRNTVIVLVVLNVVTAAAALPGRLWGAEAMAGLLLFSLISYYFLVETFAPGLGKEEMSVLPEDYAVAYL